MSTTDRRQRLFGEVIGGEVILSTMGGIVQEEWLRTEIIRKEITLEAYVIMPNHFHGIVVIETSSSGSGSVRAHGHAPQPGGHAPQPSDHAPQPSDRPPQPGGHTPQPSGPASLRRSPRSIGSLVVRLKDHLRVR